MKGWSRVAAELEAGRNPYVTTTLLNWPPLWIFVVWALERISLVLSVPFLRSVQLFLIAAEAGLVAATDRLMAELGIARRRNLLLFGFAVNPILVLLTCQHGNFDALPALAIVLFLLWLFRWVRSGGTRPSAWLAAVCFLGLGILAKTVPAILSPVALARSRDLRRRTLAAGAALAFGPAALGVGVLLLLAPGATLRNVLAYRSAAMGFGWSALFRGLGGEASRRAYAAVLPLLILAVLAGVARWARRLDPARPKALLLVALLLVVGIPLFGSGYGPQYLFWFWPLLLCLAPISGRVFRLAVGAFAAVAVATYVVEYALVDYLGQSLLWDVRASRLREFGALIGRHLSLANAPLFAAYLAVFAAGIREIVQANDARSGHSAAE